MADNTATVVLYSASGIGEARLRATVSGSTKEVRIRFEAALPNLVVLSLSKATVMDSGDDKITATATLLRQIGRRPAAVTRVRRR